MREARVYDSFVRWDRLLLLIALSVALARLAYGGGYPTIILSSYLLTSDADMQTLSREAPSKATSGIDQHVDHPQRPALPGANQ